MENENPFEAPTPERATFIRPPDGPNLWRDGPFLVAAPGAEFPARCIKCNRRSGSGRFRRLLKSRDGRSGANLTVELGLCEKHLLRAQMRQLWPGLGLTAIALGVIILTSMKEPEAPFIGALLTCLGVLILCLGPWLLGVATLTLKKSDPPFLWLRGVCREFLDESPHVPNDAVANP
jgi:hypothetical protein